jgi:hypothetical protein
MITEMRIGQSTGLWGSRGSVAASLAWCGIAKSSVRGDKVWFCDVYLSSGVSVEPLDRGGWYKRAC